MATTPWVVYPDFNGGSNCYYNTETGTATWTKPPELRELDDDVVPVLVAGGSGDEGGGADADVSDDGDYDGDDARGGWTSDDASVEGGDDEWATAYYGATAGGGGRGGGSKELQGGTDSAAELCSQPKTEAPQGNETKVVDTTPFVWVRVIRAADDGTLQKPAEWPQPEDPDTWRFCTYKTNGVDVQARWVVRNGISTDDLSGYLHNSSTDKTRETLTKVTTKTALKKVTRAALDANTADLSLLDDLKHPLILFKLQQRFAQKIIYTDIGSVVVSVNPGKPVVIEDPLQKYIDGLSQQVPAKLDPHVYHTAHVAYNNVVKTSKSQGFIISGESGSGKTHTTKVMIQYMLQLAAKRNRVAAGVSGAESTTIAVKIENADPVLEAFGNAKTRNNDNSSRFGKYLQLFIDVDTGAITGAEAKSYLLEKVRVVQKATDECNYHVFYLMMAGLNATRKSALHLDGKGLDYFKILNTTAVRDEEEDRLTFTKLEKAFGVLGFVAETVNSIFQVLAAILHCGNIGFGSETNASLDIDDASLVAAAQLLGVDKAELRDKFLEGGIKSRTPAVAHETRNALCKYLYGYVFNFIVVKVNEYTSPPGSKRSTYVGCLDIFGFEQMETNSFEQLCINYTNEALQAAFKKSTVLEQLKIYDAEKVKVPNLTVTQTVDDGVINDIARFMTELQDFPSCDDNKFLKEKMRPQPGKDANKQNFSYNAAKHKNKNKKTNAASLFQVHHYAGTVTYDIGGFCSKTQDKLDDELAGCMRKSSKVFVRNLIPPEPKRKTTPKYSTLGTRFIRDVDSLIKELRDVTPHYVRCVKSNQANTAWVFHADKCYEQLMFSGIFDTVEIRALGYPFTPLFAEFNADYDIVLTELGKGPASGEPKEKVQAVIDLVKDHPKTKILDLPDDAVKNAKLRVLYRGSWHRAFETLRQDAQHRKDVREEVDKILRTGERLKPETAPKFIEAVYEARALNLFAEDPTVFERAEVLMNKYSDTSMDQGVVEQFKTATTDKNKEALAQLVINHREKHPTAATVTDARELVCKFVEFDTKLATALGRKNEQEIRDALKPTKGAEDGTPDGPLVGYNSDKVKAAVDALQLIADIRNHVAEAQEDGIEAHAKAVCDAADEITFTDIDVKKICDRIRYLEPSIRVEILLGKKNWAEAVRVKMQINHSIIKEAPEALKEYLLARHPHNDQGTPSAEPRTEPPFTRLLDPSDGFQYKMLEEAAIQNYETVKAFLAPGAKWADFEVKKLQPLLESCFMYAGLRDELFVSIFKASNGTIKDNVAACTLLRIALGHFGCGSDLTSFVYAMVKDCDENLKLQDLLAFRMLREDEANDPGPDVDDAGKMTIQNLLDNINARHVGDLTPRPQDPAWAALVQRKQRIWTVAASQ